MTTQQKIAQAEESLALEFKAVDAVEQHVFERVLASFHEHRVAVRHFTPTTGYGYGDEGRDTFEAVFASAMGAKDALVRPTIASGTHALTICLFAMLRPGQTLLYASGTPYDTLRGVIGIDKGGGGSLRDWKVGYRQVELQEDDTLDIPAILHALQEDPTIKVVAFQRSRGYLWRSTISLNNLQEAIVAIENVRKDVRIMVDNCYGEFVCKEEPCALGAHATVGSLIKNPGGGLAPTGGYIVGTHEVVDACAQRLTAPHLGKEIGSWAAGYQLYYQGLYLAPHVVAQAVKGAMLASVVFAKQGYLVSPKPHTVHQDIIQVIRLAHPSKVIAFCKAIQAASPVDAHATPEPWPMPGYQHDVIMAAGTFVGGASIELSADAPIREPYNVYLQGGLTYTQARFAIAKALDAIS